MVEYLLQHGENIMAVIAIPFLALSPLFLAFGALTAVYAEKTPTVPNYLMNRPELAYRTDDIKRIAANHLAVIGTFLGASTLIPAMSIIILTAVCGATFCPPLLFAIPILCALGCLFAGVGFGLRAYADKEMTAFLQGEQAKSLSQKHKPYEKQDLELRREIADLELKIFQLEFDADRISRYDNLPISYGPNSPHSVFLYWQKTGRNPSTKTEFLEFIEKTKLERSKKIDQLQEKQAELNTSFEKEVQKELDAWKNRTRITG